MGGEKIPKAIESMTDLGSPPRGREKAAAGNVLAGKVGSPPRMRGKAARNTGNRAAPGITPACAGKRYRHKREGKK